MNIDEIKLLCKDDTIEVTQHILLRLQQRKITYKEIKEAILNGEIIEDYPEDFPYPSCLILGITIKNRVIHIVVGIGENKLWLITAYEPDSNLWDSDFKKRKGWFIMDKCFYCKGIMKNDYNNYMVDLDGHFIIIKNVPCHKCSQCGEVSYSGEVVARIEEIVEKLKDALAEVAVVEYVA